MEKFYTKRDYLRYAKQQIINQENAILATDALIRAVKQFDGKVLNKRFPDAVNENLKEIGLKNTTFYTKENEFTSTLYVRDNDSYSNEADKNGYSSCNYIDYIYYMPVICKNDKRISAERLIPLIEEVAFYIRKNQTELQADISKIDDLVNEFNAINDKLREFNASVNSVTKSLFNLNEKYSNVY